MASDPATPLAWRAISLGSLVGGFALGGAAIRSGAARFVVAGAMAVVAGFVVPIVRASRRAPIEPADAAAARTEALPTVSVVIAARDEATVLPRLILDLGRQDHRDADGRPRFDIVVVDDRSTDGTAEAAIAAATEAGIAAVTRVVRRDGAGLPDGKGAALAAAQPETCSGDVVLVFDADARVGPGLVRTIAGYVAAGATAVTARRRILDAGSSWLAGAQADEQAQDGELQRGRWASGGCSEFRGNGIAVRRDALISVGGWRPEALTEDIDLATRLAARLGVTVAWAVDAEVWEEPVLSWSALLRQRLRWSEGGIRRVLELGPELLASPRLGARAKLDFVAYALQLVSPGLILGALAGAVAGRRPGAAVALVGTYVAAGGVLAFDALRWEVGPDGRPPGYAERTARGLRGALFGAVWLIAIPGAILRLALRRGPVRYDKMAHVGSASFPEDAW